MSTAIAKFDKLSGYFTGTTSATANEQSKVKKVIPSSMKGTSKFIGIFNGEGVYLEGGSDWDRQGINFPNTKTVANAGSSSSIRSCMLTNSLGVVICIISTKLYAYAFTVGNGGALTYGSAATVNDADTGTKPAICRISDSTYAIAYADDGGDDYLCVRMGSVSGTTITQGDEKEMTAAAITKDAGIGICQPREGVIAVGYSDANSYGTVISATFTNITVGTPGTAVSATGTDAVTEVDICSHSTGYVTLAYADVSTNYVTVNIGTVSAAAAVAFAGSEEALNAVSSSDIRISSPQTDRMVVSWLDSGDPHLIAGGVVAGALTSFVQGTEASIATTATVPRHACPSPNEVVIAWCDDAHAGDYGHCKRYTISWAATGAGTLTADSNADIFCESSCKSDIDITPTTDGEVIVHFVDVGSSSYLAGDYGQIRDDIIDIRAAGASATYSLWLAPIYEYVRSN